MTTNQTIDGVPRECKACGGTSLTWFAQSENKSGVQEGRLRTHEVSSVFVLGCDDCSETLRVVSADKMASLLNKRAAGPQGEHTAAGFLERMLKGSGDDRLEAWQGEMAMLLEHIAENKPQGEPVAWVVFDNGFIDDHTVVKTVADEWADRGLEVTPLYAEQPAPAAVLLPERKSVNTHNSHDWDEGYSDGWVAYNTELKRLNPSL